MVSTPSVSTPTVPDISAAKMATAYPTVALDRFQIPGNVVGLMNMIQTTEPELYGASVQRYTGLLSDASQPTQPSLSQVSIAATADGPNSVAKASNVQSLRSRPGRAPFAPS